MRISGIQRVSQSLSPGKIPGPGCKLTGSLKSDLAPGDKTPEASSKSAEMSIPLFFH